MRKGNAAEKKRSKKNNKCGMLYYAGFGSVYACGKQAVAILDQGKPGEYSVCSEHVKVCHSSRLTTITEASHETR